jgi:maleate isomerase
MYGYRAKIGLLIPEVNTTMEGDFHRFVPRGVSVHTARVSYGEFEEPEASVHALDAMVKNLERATREIARARVDVVCYGCSSATFYEGHGWDQKLIGIMSEIAGVPALTASTAMLEAFRVLNIRRLSVATPYPEDINERLRLFLTSHGLDVIRVEGLQQKDLWDHARVSREIIYNLARRVNGPEAEGVFISCTQLRAADIVEELEQDIQKPVITANQCSLWMSLRKVAVFDPLPGLGRLGNK